MTARLTRSRNYGDRYLAAAGPKLRNSLPAELRQADIIAFNDLSG